MGTPPLKIGVEIDTTQLGKLASASQEVAASTTTMSSAFANASSAASDLARRFIASGMSAKDAQDALIGLGYSARAAAAVMAELGGATAIVGTEAAATATKVDKLSSGLAYASIRMGASEAGAGQLGYALARLGSSSAALAPILASTFAVFAIIGFIQIVENATAAYEKWISLGEKTVHEVDDQTLSLQHESDALDVTNARLQEQIDKLEHKPVDYMGLFLAEDRVRADQLAKSLEDVLQKEVQILETGPGLGSQIFLGTGNLEAVGKMLEPLEQQLQIANLTNDREAQRNILLEKQAILQKALTEEQAHRIETLPVAVGVPGEVGRMPDPSTVATLQSLLKGVQTELENIGKTAKSSSLEQQLAALEAAAQKQAADTKRARAEEEAERHIYRIIDERDKAELEGISKRQKAEEEAQRAIGRVIKANAEEELKAAREAEAAWQRAAEARIRGEEESFSVSQRSAENDMRRAKNQESLASAGIGRGPVASALEAKSLGEQQAIAASAWNEATAAADHYRVQLDIVQSVMAEVDQNTEAGAKQFRDLQTQMEQLQRLFDNANEAAARWGNTLDSIKVRQKQMAMEMNFSLQSIHVGMENAAQAGFQAFNSAFLRMAAGGMSFSRVMISLWNSMADSFITTILKMGEEWVVQHVLMMALDKLFGITTVATSAAATAAKIGENKALAMSEAGLAGAGGVASMAAAPFPIDLTAPAFGASMMATAAGFAAFEQGGIVKANLHEGEAVLPAHLTTFLMSAAGAPGGIGGAGGVGGPGGPGGPGGAAGHTFNFYHTGSGSPTEMKQAGRDFMKQATRELRRSNRI
jgi:hypothetical protein